MKNLLTGLCVKAQNTSAFELYDARAETV